MNPLTRRLTVSRTALAMLLLVAGGAPCVHAFDELPDSVPMLRAPHPLPLDSLPATEPPAPSPTLDPGLQRDLQVADSLVKARGGPSAGDSRLLLSWNAPWGDGRARTSHRMSCRADATADTLYLSLECGRESATFNGFLAELVVRAAPGDSLGSWWSFEQGGANAGQLLCDFGPNESMPGEQPWKVPGQGIIRWTREGGVGKVRMAYAISYKLATPVHRGRIYTLARLVLHHRRELLGCADPVCIEWASASLAFALKDESTIATGERFVSLQSDDRAPCGVAGSHPRTPAPRR